ncbi:hypothetical protein ACVWXM_009978 [Bradyrhizobium sp. GM7.3]
MERLDLASQSIPFELLNGVGAGANRQICDQLPLDFLSILCKRDFLRTMTPALLTDGLRIEGGI